MKKCVPLLIMSLCIFIAFASCNAKKSNTGGSAPTAITVGTTYTQSITAYGTNCYIISPTITGLYTVSVTGITSATSNIDWELFNYISDNDMDYINATILAESYSSTTNGNEVKSNISLTAGAKYFLIIDEWNTVATNYTLKVTQP